MSSRRRTDHTETVRQAIEKQGSGTPQQIAGQTGLSSHQVNRALAQLESTGEATPAHEGKSGATVWDTTDES